MKHKNENRYLHCTKCTETRQRAGLAIFVTPTGDLGIQCVEHDDFVMMIPSDEIEDHSMGIAMQPFTNPECKCESEVTH